MEARAQLVAGWMLLVVSAQAVNSSTSIRQRQAGKAGLPDSAASILSTAIIRDDIAPRQSGKSTSARHHTMLLDIAKGTGQDAREQASGHWLQVFVTQFSLVCQDANAVRTTCQDKTTCGEDDDLEDL